MTTLVHSPRVKTRSQVSAASAAERSAERTVERSSERSTGSSADIAALQTLREVSAVPATERMAERTSEPPSESVTLQALLREVRELREDRARFARREEELLTQLRQGGAAGIQRYTGQSFSNFASRDIGFPENNCGIRLKPDTFDGGAPLREFLIQFNFIARANRWDESVKAFALASSLRGKARAVLDGFEEAESLNFAELEGRLKLRFGDEHSGQTYYSLFTNRKQKFGEDLPTFGADLERLSRLAYPECSFEVRDKIACAQFITALSDGFVKRTLQLEGVISLRKAIERGMAVKVIQENSFSRKGEGGFKKFDFNSRKSSEQALSKTEKKENKFFGKDKQNFKTKYGREGKECWLCGKSGHFRAECPSLHSEDKGNSD